MYGKLFASMFTGTLHGQWEAIVTFQQMIILCDADGILDMTPNALAATTSIPLEIIQRGLETLSKPDPHSRTPGAEGRRIEPIDAHRPWGWHIINHEKYKTLRDSDTVRAQTRERVRKHRDQNRSVTVGNAQKRHTDTDTDTDTKTNTPTLTSAGADFEVFWKAYPKKVARQEAIKAFVTLNLTNGDFSTVMTALEAVKRTDQWQKDKGQYIPNAATWLSGRRFEDEAVDASVVEAPSIPCGNCGKALRPGMGWTQTAKGRACGPCWREYMNGASLKSD